MNIQAKTAREAYLKQFTLGYIECALWSSTDDNGKPLDSGDYEASAKFKKEARADCREFIKQNKSGLVAFAEQYGLEPSSLGHDFWLTRNRHGAGFWARGLTDKVSQRLTDSAKYSGEVYLYVYRKKVFAS